MSSDAVQLVAWTPDSELVTYTPYGGVAKQFKAIVDREPSRVTVLTGVAYPENAMLVTFPYDATDGMTAVAKGKDRVQFKRSRNDSLETLFTVVMVQFEDLAGGGMWTVLVK